MEQQRTILNLQSKEFCPMEEARLERLLAYERAARLKGRDCIAGVDEAGRGCLAGPVVAGACILPESLLIVGLNDSKQLSPEKRENLYEILTTHPEIYIGIGVVEPSEIDRINIYQATIVAMSRALENLKKVPDFLLVDGLDLRHPSITCQKIIKGDTLSLSIAAASIAAKVYRDRCMLRLHEKYPMYRFDRHKGYGTEAHMAALAQHGACPDHRRSYAPVRNVCQPQFAF